MININYLEKILEKDGIIFLTYGGTLTQSLIVAMTEALEKETENAELSMGLASKIFTIFIELAQNMMNYSKKVNQEGFDPKGLILVGKTKDGYYYVFGQNIVDENDKNKIESKIKNIINLNKDEIKKLYREVRKSGKYTHTKGGGIGFYEIAKKSEKIEYDFVEIGNKKYYFQFKSIVGKS
ncbi:SiaB family protein kinase [Nautilia lithotrophica]